MKRALTGLTAAVLVGSGALASAADEPKQIIDYRDSVMHALGGHAGAIAAIMKGEVTYEDQVLPHAKALAATAPTVGDLFPEGSGPDSGVDTRALPAIWDESEQFKQSVEDFEKAADAFLEAARGGKRQEMLAAFKQLGDGCGGCHEDFRKEEEAHSHSH